MVSVIYMAYTGILADVRWKRFQELQNLNVLWYVKELRAVLYSLQKSDIN